MVHIPYLTQDDVVTEELLHDPTQYVQAHVSACMTHMGLGIHRGAALEKGIWNGI